ncbi:MAG: trypsin-like peptidase domain-containing protein [Chthoniobacterales bacterium]|jgi:serine protease Do
MVTLVRALFPLVLLSVVAAAQDPPAAASVRALGNAFSSVYERVAPSVVVLEVAKSEDASGTDAMLWDLLFPGQPGAGPRPRLEEAEGSGFIVREDGYILTNAHVVEGADPETGVVARRQDGTRLPLTIVGVDDKTDLAVLKADAEGLPAIEWGDSDRAKIGEFVCGIGAPFELDYTLTVGVLSAKGRSNLTRDTVYEDYLQTDAAINPGNSGGPLCDLDGRVIGVNTLINGLSRGLSFAIPSKLAREVSDALIAGGRVVRPWLGVRITTLGEEVALQEMLGIDRGVLVKTIEPDAPAASSELRPADVIVAVDGERVDTARDLQKAILRKKIGQQVDLKVWRRSTRDGAFRKIAVTTGELPAAPFQRLAFSAPTPSPREDGGRPPAGAAVWGLELEDVEPGSPGVRVTAVESGSPAAVADIEPGDIITGVGPEAVADEESFLAAMAKVAREEAAVLMIERGGKKTYAILKR